MVMGLISGLSLANYSDSESFLVAQASLSQDGFYQGPFWEVSRTCDNSFWPFLNSSSWRWLVSSMVLTWTSCRKIAQANGYLARVPGQGEWFQSLFPLTLPFLNPLFCYRRFIVVIQLPRCVWLFPTPWTAVHQASLSLTISRSLPKFMSIVLLIPSNHLVLCHSLLLLPSIFLSIRIFSNKSAHLIRWPKYWSFSVSPSNEY